MNISIDGKLNAKQQRNFRKIFKEIIDKTFNDCLQFKSEDSNLYFPIIMASQQPFYKKDSDSLEQLQVFSRFSEEDQRAQIKPSIKKISTAKHQRKQIQHQKLHKPIGSQQNYQPNSNQPNKLYQNNRVTAISNNKPLHQLYNQEITILRQQIERLKQVISIMENNYKNQIEFHIREHYSVLLTLNQLINAKQYQRVQSYLSTQLVYINKKHGDLIIDLQNTTKQVGSKDETIQSVVEEDPCFKKIVSNLSENIKETGIDKIDLFPQIKKLSKERQLTVKKLSWYLSQIPFEIQCKNQRHALSKQIISDLKYQSGDQIIELIQKNISKKSRLATGFKSEISELIAGHMIY